MTDTKRSCEQSIINGDCLEAMADMDENSIHAVVTDPPYNFEGGFMGEEWDNVGTPKEYQAWCEAWAIEARRVLKPGGHLIAFSSTGAYHRLASGVEDAGFDIRNQLDWNYGQGFPKGATPAQWMDGDNAEQWDGWKTALKPAHEPAVLARAPMSESAVYRNVLEHGCGALNIDRTRIPTEDTLARETGNGYAGGKYANSQKSGASTTKDGESGFNTPESDGRYPANLLLDGVAARMLDEQSGELGCGTGDTHGGFGDSEYDYGDNTDGWVNDDYSRPVDNGGGASRFFYTAKSSKNERTINGQVENDHPTVKPLSLMSWLVTLVTAPGQRVLDPFAGSGTTIMACRRLGRGGIGIEQDADHAELARQRVDLAHELDTDFGDDMGVMESTNSDDNAPATLESFNDD